METSETKVNPKAYVAEWRDTSSWQAICHVNEPMATLTIAFHTDAGRRVGHARVHRYENPLEARNRLNWKVAERTPAEISIPEGKITKGWQEFFDKVEELNRGLSTSLRPYYIRRLSIAHYAGDTASKCARMLVCSVIVPLDVKLPR